MTVSSSLLFSAVKLNLRALRWQLIVVITQNNEMNIILQYGKAHKNKIFVSGMIRPSDQSKPHEEGLEKEGGFLPGQNIIDTVIPLLEDKANMGLTLSTARRYRLT